jgi:hypothetical protein
LSLNYIAVSTCYVLSLLPFPYCVLCFLLGMINWFLLVSTLREIWWIIKVFNGTLVIHVLSRMQEISYGFPTGGHHSKTISMLNEVLIMMRIISYHLAQFPFLRREIPQS